MSRIVLASASPRRKELLEQIGLEFEICPAKGEEVITAGSVDGGSVRTFQPESGRSGRRNSFLQ